jgi:putative ABC transport system substrate-binding protein
MDRINAHAASTGSPVRGNRPTRRQFLQSSATLASLSLLSGCTRLPFAGANTSKVRTIGALWVTNPINQSWMETWETRLSELGYVDGQNVVIERRIAADIDSFGPLVDDLMRRKVDTFMAAGWSAIYAAKQATATIPIVGVSSDPVGTGLVNSIARPGGNITGTTTLSVPLAAKRVEYFKETIAGLKRVGIISNSKVPDRKAELDGTLDAARKLGLDVLSLEVNPQEEFQGAFEQASAWKADGMILLFDQMTLHQAPALEGVAAGEEPLAFFMAKYRIPAVCDVRVWAETGGGLTTYGPDFPGLFARAADMTDKILAGARPADIPIEQPTKFVLTINLNVARQMGLTIPPSALALADNIVQ